MEVRLTKRFVVYAVLILMLPLSLLLLPRPRPPSAVAPTSPSPQPVPTVTKPLPGSRNPWTLTEARDALKRRPDDSYLQFVVLQLASQESRLAEVREDIPLFATRRETNSVDLFGLFRNSRVVQQQLQLETIVGARDWLHTGGTAIPLEKLTGPSVADRPWKKLLAGKAPQVTALSRCVPEDFYLAEFRSLDRLVAALDASRSWVGFLATQVAQDATDRDLRRRVQEQLVFDAGIAVQQLVEQAALTGSDLFLGEGSDVTLILQLKPEAIDHFRDRTRRALAEAASRPDAWPGTGKHMDVEYSFVLTPDRRISAYAATLKERGLHVRSNSKEALHRVIEAIYGYTPTNAPVRRLGERDELRYVRTLLAVGDNEEDGLVYLSTPLLNRLLGPALQITEARRLIGLNHLRMIAHAAQLYRTQFGKAPSSLDDLALTGCAPGEFNKGILKSPFGGTYTLSDDKTAGVCSVLGTADFLKPCCELPRPPASVPEAGGYDEFVRAFSRQSNPMLGPIALRVQTGTRHLRVEAVLFAPPDNPIAAALARHIGGTPEPLDPLPVAKQALASFGLRLNKDRWIAENLSPLPAREVAAAGQVGAALASVSTAGHLPWATLAAASDHVVRRSPRTAMTQFGIEPARLKDFLQRGIGNQAGLHVCDAAVPFDVNLPSFAADLLGAASTGELDELGLLYELGLFAGTLTMPAYVAVPIKDVGVVDDFLTHLDTALANKVPAWRDHLFGTNIQGEFYRLTTKANLPVRALGVRAGPARYRVFWARIDDGLYIANQPGILDEVQAAYKERLKSGSSDRGPAGHAMIKLRPGHAALAMPGFRLGWEEANREACQRNLAMLSAAARAFSFTPPVAGAALDHEARRRLVLAQAARMHGCDFVCPDGGQYLLSQDGKTFSCTIHGSAANPVQPDRPTAGGGTAKLMETLTDVTATLTVSSESLRVVLIIGRK